MASFANSGNLLFTAAGGAAAHQRRIRRRLEEVVGFEVTTLVRTAAEVVALATDKPFGVIADGHTHFALLLQTPPTAAERAAAEALSTARDEVVVAGRDVHWLIRAASMGTSLGPAAWRRALPDNPTTARNTTMLARLVTRL